MKITLLSSNKTKKVVFKYDYIPKKGVFKYD